MDKEKEDVLALGMAVGLRLFLRDVGSDNNLAVLRADGVGEDVRRIPLASQALIEAARHRGRNERERDLPARENLARNLLVESHLALTLHAACGRVNLAELDELVIVLAARFGNHRPLVVDVLALRALPVAAVAQLAHEAEPLRAAGETADKRRRTLVLAALDLDSCAGRHVGQTLAYSYI